MQRQSAVCPGPAPLTSSVRSFTRHFPRCRHLRPVQNLRASRLTHMASQFDQPWLKTRAAMLLPYGGGLNTCHLQRGRPPISSAPGMLRIKPFIFQDDLAENRHPGPTQQVSLSQEEMGTMCSPQTTAVRGLFNHQTCVPGLARS